MSRRLLAALGLLTASFVGCSVLHQAGVPGLEQYVKDPHAPHVAEQRENYQVHHDGDSLNWLLAHRVHTGQSVAEISGILGEEGERYWNDRELKNGSAYLQTDEGYRWGPDSNGRSVILFFRDGKLVNFDPNEFRG